MVSRVRLAVASGLLAAILISPVGAGWFDGPDAAKPVDISGDEMAAQIQVAVDDQRYLDAGKMLDQALLADGGNPKLVLLAGELSLVNGRYDAALSNFKTVDSKPEQRARALEGEGMALSLTGKSDDAVTALKAAVAADQTLWHAWNALGTEYDRRHDWKDAEDAYSHAIANPASTAIVLNNRGFSRLCQNRLEEAVSDFVSALAKKPDLVAARNNLRLAIGMTGDYNRAMEGADPNDRAAVLNNVGFAALMRGDYETAKNLFDEAIKARGTYYAVAATNLATAQGLQSGNHDKPQDPHAGAH